jgi:hypothetical protein
VLDQCPQLVEEPGAIGSKVLRHELAGRLGLGLTRGSGIGSWSKHGVPTSLWKLWKILLLQPQASGSNVQIAPTGRLYGGAGRCGITRTGDAEKIFGKSANFARGT